MSSDQKGQSLSITGVRDFDFVRLGQRARSDPTDP